MDITFITSNPAKAEQLAYHLKMPITHRRLDLPEIQSLDLEEIVRNKAQRAYDILHSPALVEDVSLTFPALGKLPGPLIKWFLGELGNDGLARLLDGKDRTAIAQVCYGLHDGTTCHLFIGEARGQITDEPRGAHAFGWDPLFIPDGSTKTWGEMTMAEQSATSMRRIALEGLERFLTAGNYQSH